MRDKFEKMGKRKFVWFLTGLIDERISPKRWGEIHKETIQGKGLLHKASNEEIIRFAEVLKKETEE